MTKLDKIIRDIEQGGKGRIVWSLYHGVPFDTYKDFSPEDNAHNLTIPSCEEVELYVVPINKVRTIPDLNRFMMELVPRIKPKEIYEAEMEKNTYERCFTSGGLIFEESIGTQIITVEKEILFRDDTCVKRYRLNSNKKTRKIKFKEDYTREIRIHIHPNENTVKELTTNYFSAGPLCESISWGNLRSKD